MFPLEQNPHICTSSNKAKRHQGVLPLCCGREIMFLREERFVEPPRLL